MIEFHLDARPGVAPYMQLIQQVRHAMRLGLLKEGDKLPTVKDVVASVAINPNTVLKAYRELEYEGLVQPRPGPGRAAARPAPAPGGGGAICPPGSRCAATSRAGSPSHATPASTTRASR